VFVALRLEIYTVANPITQPQPVPAWRPNAFTITLGNGVHWSDSQTDLLGGHIAVAHGFHDTVRRLEWEETDVEDNGPQRSVACARGVSGGAMI
jgi:hypothetical protein